MTSKPDNADWKRELAKTVKANKETAEMTGKLALHLYKGELKKVKIEEKEI